MLVLGHEDESTLPSAGTNNSSLIVNNDGLWIKNQSNAPKRAILESSIVIDLELNGLSPTNTAVANTAAIEAVMASLVSTGGHVRLMQPGTYLVQQGATTLHSNLRACILVPSNTIFELGPGVRLKLINNGRSYIIRNRNPMSGNSRITIRGGIYDGNKTNDPFPGAPADYSLDNASRPFYGFLGRFENITDLVMEDITSVDPIVWAWNGVRLTRANFQRFFFDDCGRDGIHLHHVDQFTIRDISGTCGDNMIALSTCEHVPSSVDPYWAGNFVYNDGPDGAAQGNAVLGDITNGLVDNIQCVDCMGPVRMFGGAGSKIERITVRNVYGSTITPSIGAVQVVEDGKIGPGCEISNILIENIACKTIVGEPQVLLSHNSARDIVIRNVAADQGHCVRVFGTGYRSVQIDGCMNAGKSGGHAVLLGGTGLSLTADYLSIKNVTHIPPSGISSGIQISGSMNIGRLEVDKLFCKGTFSSAITAILTPSTAMQTIYLGDLHCDGGNLGVFAQQLNIVGGRVFHNGNTYLSYFGPRVQLDSYIVQQGTSTPGRVFLGGSLTVKDQWLSRTVTFSDVNASTGTTVGQISLGNLPRGTRITQVDFVVNQAFVGNPCTVHVRGNASVQLGPTIDLNTLGRSFTALASTGGTAPNLVGTWAGNATPSLLLHFVSSSGNFALTAGFLIVNIKYHIVGENH